MFKFIYWCLFGIIFCYNYLKFSYNLPRDNYSAIKTLFLWCSEILALNVIFIIIDKYLYKITIVENIKSQIFILIILELFYGLLLFCEGYDVSEVDEQ